MKIAQVAPLYESVPPKYYGGTERVVSYLTEALVQMGHDITLYASGDSVTEANLRVARPRAVRLDPESVDGVADHILLAERVFQEAEEFDLVHSHIDYLPYPLWRRMKTPRVTTLHGRLDIPNLRGLYKEFADEPVISISDYQRRPLHWANWLGTVYHGLPGDLYRFYSPPGDYLAFLGRASPEKRVDEAIKIARRAGVPLKIAAKVDKTDQDYFDTTVKPLLNEPGVEFLGEIRDAEKGDFLGNALALLFPIDWPEPFGLVVIEAMACGTPVIATRRGSVPELIEHGVNGFVVDDAKEAVDAIAQLPTISRRCCRQMFEERFTAERMARDYLEIYEQMLESDNVADELAP